MGVADLCLDSVQVITSAPTIGDSFGRVEHDSPGATLACFVQTPSASEISLYATRGQQLTHSVYFPENPGFPASPNEISLLWNGKYLNVLAVMSEGRPGEDMLWIAMCEYQSSRRDDSEDE